VIAIAAAITGCNNTVAGNPPYLAVDITTRPASIPVGGTYVFTAIVSDTHSVPQWSILAAAATPSAGALAAQASPPISILYTAPATPPIYNSSAPPGYTQGTVTLDVSAPPPAGTPFQTATDSVTFFITAPAISVGLSPATANVALGATQQFFGYAVGAVNNALLWQVNGVTGGSASNGTVTSPFGTYTAPANLPMGGNTVTISVISQADPTKSASSVVTLH
jgi:hypothetical protein